MYLVTLNGVQNELRPGRDLAVKESHPLLQRHVAHRLEAGAIDQVLEAAEHIRLGVPGRRDESHEVLSDVVHMQGVVLGRLPPAIRIQNF